MASRRASIPPSPTQSARLMVGNVVPDRVLLGRGMLLARNMRLLDIDVEELHEIFMILDNGDGMMDSKDRAA
eukprot:790397-Amphidinium_carterae.1